VVVFENGFLVFMGKEAVLAVRLRTIKNNTTTFTDLYRNKFGVNRETFIY
jgi:hypothetical protein